jgi:hypothetical protein
MGEASPVSVSSLVIFKTKRKCTFSYYRSRIFSCLPLPLNPISKRKEKGSCTESSFLLSISSFLVSFEKKGVRVTGDEADLSVLDFFLRTH